MKNKIKDYIDLIFADAPDCARTREVKEEMFANVCDRYDDLIKEGKSESAAYNISISGIGDISELIETIKAEHNEGGEEYSNWYGSAQYKTQRPLTEKETEEIATYRKKRGIMNAVAISLYILCWIPLVFITAVVNALGGNDDIAAVIGLCIMMLMIAAATILMVMKSSIKPLCLKGVKNSELDDDDDDDDDDDGDNKNPKKAKKRKNPILSAISGALWALTVCIYIGVSFWSGAWHITWLIFLITTAIDNIIEAIFEMCHKRYI